MREAMADFTHVTQPTVIPVPGNKLIEEFIGLASTQTGDVSVAHMKAPPGWGEPAQTPEFAEITIMVSGTMRIEIGDETVDLKAGEVIRTEAGVRVRYTNPFDEPNEYYAVCLPAFAPDLAHRDE
jgi:mannose-6-phosphate isomerase-like protein (cupin superfamily)